VTFNFPSFCGGWTIGNVAHPDLRTRSPSEAAEMGEGLATFEAESAT